MGRSVIPAKRPALNVLASIAIILGLLYFARDVLIAFSLAMLLAFLLAPAVTRLERWGLRRVASTLVVVLLSLSLVGAFVWVVERQVAQIVASLPEYRESSRAKLQRIAASAGLIGRVKEEIKHAIAEMPATTQSAAVPSATPVPPPPPEARGPRAPAAPTPQNPMPVRVYPPAPAPLEELSGFLTRLYSPLATAGLVLILVIFMLVARESLRDRIIRLVGGQDRLHATTDALDDAATRIARFLKVQALINVTAGAVVALGLYLIDITLGGARDGIATALLWGGIWAILRFVPYIGAWIAASFPLALAFAVFPGNTVFFVTLAMFVVIELVLSQAVEPNFFGARTGMSPMAVLAAAVFWTWIWGPIGLLLSTPLTVIVLVLGRHVPQLRFLVVMLGDEPVLDPHTRIYQRLLANDAHEALASVRQHLKEMPLADVYDQVLLPVLAAAARDAHTDKLDDDRYASVCRGIKEIVENVADSPPAPAEAAAPDQPRTAAPPPGHAGNVLCLGAGGEADEIVGLMLAQLLSRRGYHVITPGWAASDPDMMAGFNHDETSLIVVSALPPRAASRARHLCRRMCARDPHLQIVAGLWNVSGDLDRFDMDELGSVRPVATLADACRRIDEFAELIPTAAN